MTRFACLRVAVVVSAVAALLAGAGVRVAHASEAVSVYVAASRVDMMPSDDAATTVAIHGAFILLKADGTWEPPTCGYMHFQCPAGSEAMCRMQWKDVRRDRHGEQLLRRLRNAEHGHDRHDPHGGDGAVLT